jgi:hypothetical protein
MNTRLQSAVCLVAAGLALAGAAACDKTTSSSSPSVTLGAPRPLEPVSNVAIADSSQPVTLVVENATTTGSAVPTYRFEVATDDRFAAIVVTRDAVPQGTGGRTSVALDRLTAGRAYYWRAQAKDGSTTGGYSAASRFDIVSASLDAPVPVSPANNATVNEARPTFIVTNSTRSGAVGSVSYTFEVSENATYSPVVSSGTVAEQAGQTRFAPGNDLSMDRVLYWRARASDGIVTSGWGVASFRTESGVDLKKVIWVKGPNIAGWAETSRVTAVRIGGGQICVEHTKLGVWPPVEFFGDPGTFAEGNFGFCANTKYMANGDGRDQWYCAAAFWNRPAQSCKSETAETLRDTWYLPTEEPMHSWIPRAGELFGIYMTTPARFWPDMRTTDERTNVLLMRWPAGGVR